MTHRIAVRPLTEADEIVAGQLLALAERWDDAPTAAIGRFAEALAKVVAHSGLEYARGWLAGLWYVGGNNRVNPDRPMTYHGVVFNLQGYLGTDRIVTAPDLGACPVHGSTCRPVWHRGEAVHRSSPTPRFCGAHLFADLCWIDTDNDPVRA